MALGCTPVKITFCGTELLATTKFYLIVVMIRFTVISGMTGYVAVTEMTSFKAVKVEML